MADDGDWIPSKEPRLQPKTAAGARLEDGDAVAQRSAQQRRMVARWSKEELEDKYLRMYEENLLLKKHARKQEDKIKRMATKLLRLVSDKKKAQQEPGAKRVRDIETEEMLEELHGKIRNLEKENGLLKEKLMVTKQQLSTQGKRNTPYSHVESRINTGIPKPPTSERITRNLRVAGPRESQRSVHSPGLPRYGHSLLEEARAENRHLEGVIEQQNEQINIYEQDIEFLREQLRVKEAEFEEDLLRIKQQMSAEQRVTLQENVDLIRLQREVKDKATKLTSLQEKYTRMEENLRTVKSSHDQVLREMEALNQQLKQEENRVMSLQNELKLGSTSRRKIVELEEQIIDLKKESEILKEANEKLVSSAFDLEREREWRQREQALKVQIAQLDATLKADVGEKGGILDRLSHERETNERLEKELRDLNLQHLQLKEQHDELKEKMKFFTKESAIDFSEIEEALVLVKQKKEKKAHLELEFLERVDEEKNKDLEKQVVLLQAEHAETIDELEKTRNMLIVQHKINKDYQMEVEAVTKKMEENRLEFDTKLDEYARLLDIRAARIKKLESQLKDIAYGTRQYRIPPREEGMEESEVEEFDESLHLQRGENLFEIHISKVTLSSEGLKQLGDEAPSIFCTYDFYEFDTQSTAVMKGAVADFEFTYQFVVKVDDFFLHYVQKDSTTVELHQAFGTNYQTVAAGQLKFRDIFDKPHGRVHGSIQLAGVGEGAVGLLYGTLDYWVRLKVPMDQALRLYKERTKALGYIESNVRATETALKTLDDSSVNRAEDNVNELHVKVLKCTGVKARRGEVQPSPYVVYKFFDFPDHDTSIVQSSNNPNFSDHKTFPVPMTADLDIYLKSQHLQVYVFDDTDPEEAAYLGMASVPLLPLSHDKAIKGIFELHAPDGTVNGTVDVQLKWQYTYLPPSISTKTPAQILATTPMKPEKVPLLHGEDLTVASPVIAAAPHSILKTPKPPGSRGPAAASTPLPAARDQGRPLQSLDNSMGDTLEPLAAPRKKKDHVGFADDVETPVKQPHPPQPHPPQPPERHHPVPPEKPTRHPPEKATPTKPTPLPRGHPDTDQTTPKTVDEEEEEEEMSEVSELSSEGVVAGGTTSGGQQDKPEDIAEEEMEVSAPPAPVRRQLAKVQRDSGSEVKVASRSNVKVTPDADRTMEEDETDKSVESLTEAAEEEDEEDEEEEESEDADDLIAQELGEKVKKGKPAQSAEDTMFEEERDEEEEDEEDSTLEDEIEIPGAKQTVEGEEEEEEEDSDSEGLVITPAPRAASRSSVQGNPDTVVVTIAHLSLEEGASALSNPAVQQLFVEYRFLGFPAEELETPVSLPKPKPDQQIYFNFKKVFHVDAQDHYESRQYLASMLLPDDPDEGRIRFTVVSEPPEDDESGECNDVGTAFVSLTEILEKKEDVIDRDIPIYDIDEESTVIGHLNVTVECYAALHAVKLEMDSD
ncbi:protein fantom isoform X2 [Lingula anatina]|uniref:Protein fantom isoform X2 n=1 Tax=Lingula anatina TaxID=7574 RepID=A0A1S3IKW5_LINAN|nr:protein fantom isoform X2 [Lingula anatina]|eukprot:XP_013398857.1 protein fantom isoform X2 [Lingula anatina]